MTDYADQAKQDDLWQWNQPPRDEAKRLRDQGVTVADHGLDTRWRGAADTVVAELAATGRPFDADDVTARLGPALGSHRGGMGSVFRRAATAKLIEPVGVTTSSRPEAHGRLIRTWIGTGRTEPAKAAKPKPPPSPTVDSRPESAGTWTAAEVPEACTDCGRPAFMRLDGAPRHRADCIGEA